ncbi:MAG: ATPase domain-containing protein, partial [Leptolyngbyaceae bacterium]|nr:ATPase domain-containing protein [Leptolyngbyaceae bacterium]
MPKPRSHYVCNQCAGESPQYFGKCPHCGAWNSLTEQVVAPDSANGTGSLNALRVGGKRRSTANTPAQPKVSLTLPQISDHPQARLSSGYLELDRVLGGGIVPGSLVLIGGDPGIGKSTLLLQTANRLARQYRTLYVCAEESGQQVKLRWQRLAEADPTPATDSGPPTFDLAAELSASTLYLMPETDLETIL